GQGRLDEEQVPNVPSGVTARCKTRSRSPQVSATRCWCTPPRWATGCGTATSSLTRRTRTACSAWSPLWSCSDATRDVRHLFFVQTALPPLLSACHVDDMTIFVGVDGSEGAAAATR